MAEPEVPVPGAVPEPPVLWGVPEVPVPEVPVPEVPVLVPELPVLALFGEVVGPFPDSFAGGVVVAGDVGGVGDVGAVVEVDEVGVTLGTATIATTGALILNDAVNDAETEVDVDVAALCTASPYW